MRKIVSILMRIILLDGCRDIYKVYIYIKLAGDINTDSLTRWEYP